MDIFKIQALIKERQIVTSSDVDPSNAYLQVGVFQEGNRKGGPGNADSYKSYAIRLSDVASNPSDFKNYLLVDGTFGNDATAVVNDDLKPFQTINAAILASSPGDVIILNPGTYFSSVFVNAMPWTLTYYCMPGASWFIGAMSNASPNVKLSIYGKGDLTFSGAPGVTGSHDQDITIECNTINMGFYWFLNNGIWGAGATAPLTLTIKAKEMYNYGAIGILFSLPWQLNIDVDFFDSTTFFEGDFWAIQNFNSAVATRSVINIRKATLRKQATSFLTLSNIVVNKNVFYVNANINYTSNVTNTGGPFIFRIGGPGTVYYEGETVLRNASMVYDQTGFGTTEKPRVEICGQVFNSDDGTASVLYTTYYANDGVHLKIKADTIVDSAANPVLHIPGVSGPNVPQVDVISCKLVNTSLSGTAPAVILKGGGSTQPLRLHDAKVYSQASTAIEGLTLGGEDVEVYSCYAKGTLINLNNILAPATTIVNSPLITDFGF